MYFNIFLQVLDCTNNSEKQTGNRHSNACWNQETIQKNELIVGTVTKTLQFYQNNFSLFLVKEGKLNLSAVSWMFPLFFEVHFVPQPSLQSGGTGAECMLPLLFFWARGDLPQTRESELPREQIAEQEIKDKHPKKQAKTPTSSLKNIKKQYSHPVRKLWVTEWKNIRVQKKKKKNPQKVFTPEIQPLVVYLETRPVSVCAGEYDWLFPDENKITITKEMTLTVQAYKSPGMNFEMTEKIQLGIRTICTHYIFNIYILYMLHIVHIHICVCI